MTDGEYPDSLGLCSAGGRLLPDLKLPVASGDPATPAAPTAASGGFRSRREMRAAGGYAVEAVAATPTVTPAAPAAAAPIGFAAPSADVAEPAPASVGAPAPVGAAPAPVKMSLRRRLSSAGVMAVVIGFAATATIPAFAEQSRLTADLEPLAVRPST